MHYELTNPEGLGFPRGIHALCVIGWDHEQSRPAVAMCQDNWEMLHPIQENEVYRLLADLALEFAPLTLDYLGEESD